MKNDARLEVMNWKFEGWTATIIVLAIWLGPFVIGYLLGHFDR